MKTLITGGSRGIGRATALDCAARGWPVVIGYRGNAAAAEETLTAVRAAGGKGWAFQADVANADEVTRLFQQAEEAMGGLEGVVINAGIVMPMMPMADMTPERIDRMVQVNVNGALYQAVEASRRLKDGGAIVVMSSAAAKMGGAGRYVDYAATKGAMDTLTIGLSKELAPRGIRVNGVRPGIIDTEIHADGGEPNRIAEQGHTVPLGRAGTAAEVAAAVTWLLSDSASYIAGTTIDVGGGR